MISRTDKVSNSQVAVAAICAKLFNLLSYDQFTPDINPLTHFFGITAAYAALFLLAIPLMLLNRKADGNLPETGLCVLGNAGSVYNIYTACALLLLCVSYVSHFEYFLTSTTYNGASEIVIILFIVLAVFLCVMMGIEAICRFSLLVLVFFTISLFLVVMPMIGNLNIINLSPYTTNTFKSFFSVMLSEIQQNSDVVIFAFLASSKNRFKPFCAYVGVSFFIYAVSSFVLYGILGTLINQKMFPFFSLATLSEFSVLERMDSFHLSSFTCVVIVRVSLYVYIISEVIKRTLHTKRAVAVAIPSVLIFIGSFSVNVLLKSIHSPFNSGIYTGVVCVTLTLYPCILLTARKIKNKKQRVKFSRHKEQS